MKNLLLTLFFCLFCTNAYAQFVDDRYFDSRAKVSTHKQVKVLKAKRHYKYAREHRTRRVKFIARYEGETYSPDPVQWVAKPLARVAGEVLGGRPTTGPRDRRGRLLPWCGWWLGQHLGLLDRKLWLARNWASIGAPASRAVGSIVVWRHHVGIITDVSGARIKVLSGNDGRAVRNRWRHIGGVIAYRRV